MSTRRERLERDREVLEAAIGTCEPHNLAALVREHRAVLAELDSLPDLEELSGADEIAARREARRAGSAHPARSQRSS